MADERSGRSRGGGSPTGQEAEQRGTSGDGSHPGPPEQIARHQRGIGRQSGSHGAHTERTEEQAVSGPPAGEHVRHGRQDVSGDR